MVNAKQWKPGDVALVRPMYCGHDDVVAVRTGVPSNMGWAYSMTTEHGSTQTWVADPDGLTVVRPLVVIDPEDREQVERLRNLTLSCLRDHIGDYQTDGFTDADLANAMQAALRSLIAPPKPEEPTGLGAVVEDAKGRKFVRVAEPFDGWMKDRDWQRIGGEINAVRNFGWADIAAVRVLAEGVQA